jgi:putative transposase
LSKHGVEVTTVAKHRMDVLDLLRKEAPDADLDFLREGLRVLVQAIMEAEVMDKTRADYGERSPERVTHRNGYRQRAWDTRVGTLDLRIPKVREGSYFPSLLEPRRRSERALLAVVQQAYVEGVSTRRVEDLVQALGCEGISKSQVSRPDAIGTRSWTAWSSRSWAGRWTAAPTPISGWTR